MIGLLKRWREFRALLRQVNESSAIATCEETSRQLREHQSLRKEKDAGSIFGMLKRPGEPARTIEDIKEATAAGWADEK